MSDYTQDILSELAIEHEPISDAQMGRRASAMGLGKY